MDVQIRIFLTFDQLCPHPMWDLSYELGRNGIDVSRTVTARMTQKGIYFEQVKSFDREAA